MESGLTTKSDYTRYTIFSLWDTYRNLHQLMTLVYPERQIDMLRSMVGMYKEWGWLPRWELYGRETYTMEGDPAAIVIADSYVKGLRDFDYKTAYEAMIKSATTPGAENPIRADIDPYIKDGYIPLGYFANDLSGDNSVSHALEYCAADYAISQMADSLGYKNDAKTFLKRAQSYRRYFCKEFGTLRPITKDGKFLEDFDAATGKNFENIPGFHEGSAWSYTFAVPHDVKGLARLMGGNKAYVKSLQYVFDEDHYDPANEPDIVYPYLFSRFKGEEWRTQREVKKLLDTHFKAAPNGIPGNDDTGTMSAWAVFSMMGFYPDCPGHPSYTLTTPAFDSVEITLNPELCGGKDKLVITTSGNGNRIKGMKVGGKSYGKYRINHKELTEAGTINITRK
jgi:predicted alpha-1,2-mannosidase